MASLQDRITQALSVLVGLPLWGTTHAGNMEMFAFGERHERLDPKGKAYDVGEYALHVQCPWRIVGPKGILVGSSDRHYPADEESDWQQFDPDRDLALLEARINPWIEEHRNTPLKVERIEAEATGGFCLFLENEMSLQVFPAISLRGDHSEYWRLFRPDVEERHFVVTGYGIEGIDRPFAVGDRCEACGYPLAGLEVTECPGCGCQLERQ